MHLPWEYKISGFSEDRSIYYKNMMWYVKNWILADRCISYPNILSDIFYDRLHGMIVGLLLGIVDNVSGQCVTNTLESDRVDCHPEPGATEASCRCRGCRWCVATKPGVPFCFFESKKDPLAHGENIKMFMHALSLNTMSH